MAWAERRGVRIEYIQLGKPQQNAYLSGKTALFVANGSGQTTTSDAT